MDLEYTLQDAVLQLKNTPRTLLDVAVVVQKIMKTLYDATFPMLKIVDPVGTRCLRTATSSPSGGCLNTSVRTANIRDISV
ncbi:hypothetical protein F4X88_07010 [Candidatus Poribacteria bacterium]|nr:hypothetical protein [Candidatus Poribacteria bacterium]